MLNSTDGCKSNATTIDSESGRSDLTITIQWPEMNIGETARVACPCGGVTSDTQLEATRYCGGDFISGGEWERPNDAVCNFSDLARELCRLTDVSCEIQ